MHRRTCISDGTSCKAESALRRIVVFLLCVIAVFAVATLVLIATANPALADRPASAPATERQLELTRFVRQECGFCHGLKLTGGLGSPLTVQALADKPRESLKAIILYGRTGTAMPGWAPHLSEADAAWIVARLLEGFPE